MIISVPDSLLPNEKQAVRLHQKEDTVQIFDAADLVIGTLPVTAFLLPDGTSLFARRDQFRGHLHPDGTLSVIRYTPLHSHSGYSMLDGASKVKDMAAVSEYAMALTDHGNMFGALDFYKEMKKAGKKPILGCEVYAETINGEKQGNHLLLLAETLEGYRNLVKLVSLSNSNKGGRYNYVSYDLMETYHAGIIASSACLGGEISQAIIRGDDAHAWRAAERLQAIFGKNNFFIEVQRHGIPEEKVVNPVLIELARDIDAKLIATADSHYTLESDREAQEVLCCLATNDTMTNPDRFKLPGTGYHILTSIDIAETFSDLPEALDNTLEIAERCTVSLENKTNYMPLIELPDAYETEAAYFEAICKEGFEKRFAGTDQFTDDTYHERLAFEMDVIKSMGFPGYFIVTWDVIRFANDNGILVGPGRGSACGSLVAYVLEITDVDPIPFGLLFERFLNPDRYSMPDIDTDFPNTRREEVIEYVRHKYGEQSVARIVTYSTLSAKRVIRDVTKALDYSFSFGGKLAEAIPDKPNTSLDDAFRDSTEFKRFYESDAEAKRIIDMALQLENLPRNTSMHACGVIISPRPVHEFVPTYYAFNHDTGTDQLTTQFDKDQVEEMGLLKMDFLGLKTLGVIDESIDLVNEARTQTGDTPITMRTIPVDDTKSYQAIQRGQTSGVFQLEGPGMTKTISQILDGVQEQHAERSHEMLLRLIATISLYRPGPMDEIPNYVKNMKNKKAVVYETDGMKQVLEETHGVIVYQEQVMQLVRDLAGFSRGQSDIVRKGMAKKVPGLMDEWGQAFIYGSEEKNIVGCVPNGIDEAVAVDIWHKMVKFSDYAFNKSHAAGYSFVSARTAWLATHYPVQFFTAMMNVFVKEKEKVQKYLATAKTLNIAILQPSVNHSQEMFSVEDTNIRFGLKGISHMGQTGGAIIREREKGGAFTTMQNFVVRMVVHHRLNTRTLNNLILAGALDDFAGSRVDKVQAADTFLELGKFIRDAKESQRPTLFDLQGTLDQPLFNPTMPGLIEMDEEIKLAKEREIAGFYITGHPLTEYRLVMEGNKAQKNYRSLSHIIDYVEEQVTMEEKGNYKIRDKFTITGVVTEETTYYTKAKGDPLKVFTLEDETGSLKCIAFADLLLEKRGLFNENDLLYLEGTVGVEGGEITFVVQSAEDLHAFKKDLHPAYLKVVGHKDVVEARRQYKALIVWATQLPEWQRRKRTIPVHFHQGDKIIDMGIHVPYGFDDMHQVRNIVGTSALSVQYT